MTIPFDAQAKVLAAVASAHKYFEVIATNIETGEDDVLFGSYDRQDCVFEKQALSSELREQGYKRSRIVSKFVDAAPDPTVYA